MTTKYLLACTCGQSLPVELNQAGRSITCNCGKTVEVPSMRLLRQLPTCDEPDSSAQRRPAWNLTAGSFFAVGLLVAVLAAMVAGGMQLRYQQFASLKPAKQELTQWVNELETASPEQLFDEWNESREFGLGDHHHSPFVMAQDNANFYVGARNVALLVMTGGVLAAASSGLLRGRS